jgi:hypothetical protein
MNGHGRYRRVAAGYPNPFPLRKTVPDSQLNRSEDSFPKK